MIIKLSLLFLRSTWLLCILSTVIHCVDTFGEYCTDNDPRCHRWAKKGECRKNPGYMTRHCRASCGICDRETLAGIVNLAELQTSYVLQLLYVFAGGFLLVFIKVYFAGGVCRSNKKLHGKVVIITGANSGIGYETALNLAWRGARLILACRDFKKGLKAMKKIQGLSGNPNIEVKRLDLASLDSVREFAADIIKDEERLDILINNAGILPGSRRELTGDGFEKCFQINYLSTFLLTKLLLPKLLSSESTESRRIVNVTSHYYKFANGGLDFSNLQGEKYYGAWSTYKKSKLAVMLATHHLASEMEGKGVTINTVHPGLSITNIHHNLNIFGKSLWIALLSPIFFLFFKSARQASQTTLHCCVADEVESITGGYFVDCALELQIPMATDSGVARKLCDVSERLLKL